MEYVHSIFLLRWCRARNFDESQIPVTSGGFAQGIPYMQCSYIIHYAIRLKRLGGFGVPQSTTLRQEQPI